MEAPAGARRRARQPEGVRPRPAHADHEPVPRLSTLTQRASLPAQVAIVVAALLFGSTFVIVKAALGDVGPFAFVSTRFLIGALALLPLALRRPRSTGELRAGAWCGLSLFVGYAFQTAGLRETSAPVSAFITYLLVVIVPVLAAALARKVPSGPTIAGVVIATAGLLLLTGGTSAFGRGEWLTLGCAFSFAVHIILLDRFAPRHDIVRLTVIQLFVVGALAAGPGAVVDGFGTFTGRALAAAAFTGLAVSGLALSLQSWGQRRVGPTHTSLILMIEPVSAAILGAIVHEPLGWRGAAGAGLILVGIAVSEIPIFTRGQAPSGEVLQE